MSEGNLIAETLSVIGNIRGRIEAQLEAGRRHPDFCLVGDTWGGSPTKPTAEDAGKQPAQLALQSGKMHPTPSLTESLADIFQQTKTCQKCVLHATRKNFVFGEGDTQAALMFIGEAPGADEDEQGRPFVGKAGQLLTKIIEAMRIKRENVYICNILKCRPPGNRNPAPDEAAACLPTLFRQISAVKPQIICTLGAVPAHILLDVSAPISALRGRFYERQQIKIMPTFHPAYLLRNPQAKKSVWEDMQVIMRELGL